MHLRAARPLFCQQFLNRLHDPQPNGPAIHISILRQFVGAHSGLNRRVVAVALYQQVGGAVTLP